MSVSFSIGVDWVVPMDWHGACRVPISKGKGDKHACSNSRGISVLSVIGKLHDRVLIKRVEAGTECARWV